MDIEKPEWLGQMEGILETRNEGVLISDDCDRVLFVNSVFEEMAVRLSANITVLRITRSFRSAATRPARWAAAARNSSCPGKTCAQEP